ncbi:MAG: glycosyl hydrolase family 95 catalytic domain-containing protein, partial [Planctomycetota bacterium]
PPKGVPSRATVDAPILGNGRLGAVITTEPHTWPLQFWIMKSSFCKLRHDHRKGGPRPFGGVDLGIPALKGGTWRTEQHIFPAITTGRFTKGDLAVNMRAYVAATEDILIVELTAEGGTARVGCVVWPAWSRGCPQKSGATDGMQWLQRTYVTDKKVSFPAEIETSASIAVKVIGGHELVPGKPVTIALAMQSDSDAEDPLASALKMIGGLTSAKLKALERAHRQWWREFWAESLVEFEPPSTHRSVQRAYYLANYVFASAMRDKVFPPGLFGLWVTHPDPSWAGDYHLNFDFQSQYYSLYKSNHIEQAATFDQPILDFIPRGKWYAQKRGVRGVYYPVGIWAKGMETSRQPTRRGTEHGGVFLGQKSNAAYCVVPMAMRWYHTYDMDYAKKVYPFVVEVANFWEDYLRFQNGRYVIFGDSVHEDIHTGGTGDMNGLLSLGLVRNVFETALDMSKEMGVDAARRKKWRHILEHMSKFPTFKKDGKTVFRYTEKGTEWVKDNSVGLQHIYPSGGVGLDDTKLAEIGRNMIDAKNRWGNDNGVNSFYPAAVRVGYDPEKILKNLSILFYAWSGRTDCQMPRSPEDASTYPNTINEMLCMSHRQVLRLFPVWPKRKDARFWNLRAEGAFLVSSALKGGVVRFVKIHSEKGRDCTIVNPWPGRAVVVYRDGRKIATLRGDRFVMKTRAGETVVLGPEGKGYPGER